MTAPPLPDGPLDQAAVLAIYQQAGGLRKGHFVLSSGRHSDTYLQSAVVLQWPPVAESLGRALAEPWRGRVDVVVGPAMGGVVIGHETARALGVRMVFAERVAGSGGLKSEAGGGAPGAEARPSGSPPVDRGSGGLKSEARGGAPGAEARPSGSPPVDRGSGGLKSEARAGAPRGDAEPSGSPPGGSGKPQIAEGLDVTYNSLS